jgi:hypothetical protein
MLLAPCFTGSGEPLAEPVYLLAQVFRSFAAADSYKKPRLAIAPLRYLLSSREKRSTAKYYQKVERG